MDLVKACPTCGADNAPTAARCGCGAFLIGIDLVERASIDTVPGDAGSTAGSEPAVPGAVTENAALGRICAYDDCAQANPADSTVCVYCNRALEPLVVRAGPAAEGSSREAATQNELARSPGSRLRGSSLPNTGGDGVRDSDGHRGSDGNRESDGTPGNDGSAADPVARPNLVRLPAKLAARFAIDQPLKAGGAEADLFIVRDLSGGQRAVIKLYRHGVEPDTEVLGRVSRAAPDQLVHLIEHGRDEGVPYELLEYCEHGSLRALLKGRPMRADAARTLLVELADAVAHLHECGVVHRDLKPENVLIRGLLPLDLVLTDFGISSVAQATMHYTSAARTLRYAAPETGSNWVGKASDYWALGMILVEALIGRHPFDGLSDAVVAHWLVTKPIDLAGIEDPRWQRLCRGLLVRDPKKRWGVEEIRRWLDGDDAIVLADEPATAPAVAIAPYRVGAHECRTPRELAVALAADWPTGVKDLKRGMLRAWLQNELRDQNLARAAADAEEALEISDDERLLRLLLRLDPALPPVFKGYDVSLSGLPALTRKALDGENEERQALIELLERGALTLFAGDPVQEVQARFEHAAGEFESVLERAYAAGAPRTLAPDAREWRLRMLLFVLEPPAELEERLRASLARLGGRAAQHCAWYRALGEPAQASAASLAARVLLAAGAAREGVATLRESARRALLPITTALESNARLREAHGAERDAMAAAIETAQEEAEVFELSQRVLRLSHALRSSFAALWQEAIFDARPVEDPARLTEIRRRIGEWATWRAGDTWSGFGEQIELQSVTEHRGYRLELASQVELRRVPYKYGTSDAARMPPGARATLADVWSCEMPALPAFAAELKMTRAQAVACARCDASGKVELQESWGSTAYPFSTTFACHDKVGVQCQTRLVWGSEQLPARGVPAFVADYVATHGAQAEAPQRAHELVVPRLDTEWLESLPADSVRTALMREAAAVTSELKPAERVTLQRLRIVWNALAEVRYRYGGKEYAIWIPERTDALPIAVEHPLPSRAEPDAAGAASDAPGPVRSDDPPAATAPGRDSAEAGWLDRALGKLFGKDA